MTLRDQIKLAIEDDGCGFDPANIPANHYGLVGMNERVRLLGGTLQIGSRQGEGARIEVVVPIES